MIWAASTIVLAVELLRKGTGALSGKLQFAGMQNKGRLLASGRAFSTLWAGRATQRGGECPALL